MIKMLSNCLSADYKLNPNENTQVHYAFILTPTEGQVLNLCHIPIYLLFDSSIRTHELYETTK